MTLSICVFVACHIALLYRLWRMKMWKTFPAFTAYILVVTVLAALPNPSDEESWAIFWAWCATVAFIFRSLMVIEVLLLVCLELSWEELTRVWVGLGCLSAAVVLAFIGMPHTDWTSLHWFVGVRQTGQIILMLLALLPAIYIWLISAPLETNTRVELWMIILLLAGKNTCAIMDKDTGFLPMVYQDTALTISYLWQASCALAWIALLRQPKRHWWTSVA